MNQKTDGAPPALSASAGLRALLLRDCAARKQAGRYSRAVEQVLAGEEQGV